MAARARPRRRGVYRDLPASIQESGTAGATLTDIPSDTRNNTGWRILIPRRALRDRAGILTNDVAVDDLGNRYQVVAPYWSPLGFNLRAERLEV